MNAEAAIKYPTETEQRAADLIAEAQELRTESDNREATLERLQAERTQLRADTTMDESVAVQRLETLRAEIMQAEDALHLFQSRYSERIERIEAELRDMSQELRGLEDERQAAADKFNSDAYLKWSESEETLRVYAHLREGFRLSGYGDLQLGRTFGEWLETIFDINEKCYRLVRSQPLVQPNHAELLSTLHDFAHRLSGNARPIPPLFPELSPRYLNAPEHLADSILDGSSMAAIRLASTSTGPSAISAPAHDPAPVDS